MYLGQKENLAFLVQMDVREYPGYQLQRVFQEKVGLLVMLVHKGSLVCQALTAQKATLV